MTKDPTIKLSGRSYRASFFTDIIDSWTRKHEDRPTLLQELAAAVKDAIRRDQEHDGDSLRGAGDGGPRGKGTHSDPTLSAAAQGLAGVWDDGARGWEQDPVHVNAVKLCEHMIEADNHLRAAHAAAVRLGVYGQRERESSLIECANPKCEKTMTGIGEDRAKDGRCPRCYKFRRRNGRDWTPNAIEGEDAA